MALFEISNFLDIFKTVSDSLDKKKENVIEARRIINDAFIKTYHYLRNNNGQYIPKPELAQAWNDASAAVMRVDRELGDMLYQKSHFWTDPDLYIRLNRQSEIIELKQIVEEMEKLRMKL